MRDECVGVVPVGGLAHRGVLGLEAGDVAGEAHGGGARGLLLERGPHRVDLGELAVRDLADPGAAVRLGDDESQRLELA